MGKREDEVDQQLIKACYEAYNDGKHFPSTIADNRLNGMTVKEFISSQRRLMQKELLSGSVTNTRGGPIYHPNSITKKGIKFVEEITGDPLFQDMVVIDTGFNSKKYRLKKWINKNKKWVVSIIIGMISLLLGLAGYYNSLQP